MIDNFPLYYGMDGLATDAETWKDLIENNKNILHVDTVNGYQVSTILVGIAYPFYMGKNRLNIFETIVFDQYGKDIEVKRCDTPAEATYWHKSLVNKYKDVNNETK